MAVANRYSNLAPARYTPRTLQELMVAPAYKRQQHDAVSKSIADTETALSQLDSLDVHDEGLQAEQKRLYDKLQSQRDTLEEEGFSRSSKSDFINFNKEYQQAVGPKGRIGKIAKAKASYDKRSEEILNNAVKLKHDPQETQKRIKEAYTAYGDKFKEDGVVEDFVGVNPPSHEDLYTDIQSYKSQLGHTITTDRGEEGYTIEVHEPTGKLVAITESGKVITKQNNEAVAAAVSALENKWLDPNGAGYKSAVWNGMDDDQILTAITSGMNVMRIKEETDTRENRHQFMNPNSPEDTSNKPSKGNMTSYNSVSKHTSAKSLEEANEEVTELRAEGTPQANAKADRVEGRVKSIKRNYDYNPATGEPSNIYKAKETSFTEFTNKWNEEPSEVPYAGLHNQEMVAIKGDANVILDSFVKGNLEVRSGDTEGTVSLIAYDEDKNRVGSARNVSRETYNSLKATGEVEKAYRQGLDKTILHNEHQNVGVMFMDLKGADRSVLDKNFNSLLSTSLNNLSLTDAIRIESGNLNNFNSTNLLEDEDSSEEVKSNILHYVSSNPEKASVVGIIQQTENGVPALEVNVSGFDASNSSSDMRVVLEIPKLSTDGTNISGVGETIISQLENYGGAQGVALAHKLRQSVKYKDIVPTFDAMNYTLDKPLRRLMPQGNLIKQTLNKEEFRDTQIGIDVVKGRDNKPTYSLKIGKSTIDPNKGDSLQGTTLTWGHILDTSKDNTLTTMDKVMQLSPVMTNDFIEAVKKELGVTSLTDPDQRPSEDELDNAINNILGHGDPTAGYGITSSDYYDLLDLISI